MSSVFLGPGRSLPLPDDEESRSRLPAAVLAAMDEIHVALTRQRQVGADWANRETIYAEADLADQQAIEEAMRDGAELPELTNGARAAKRVHQSKLASQAAGRIVEDEIGAYLAAVREAVELPGELTKEADEIVTRIDGWLGEVNELMRQWVWLNSLTEHVRAVQAGREPHSVNVKGDDQKVLMAVTTLRSAVRMATRGATMDDKIAAGVIFNVPMDTTPLGPDPNVVDGKTVLIHP